MDADSADELEGASADELERGQCYSIAKCCVSSIEPPSVELTDLRRKQHDNDILGAEGELSSSEPPAGDSKRRKGRKRRRTEGVSTSSIDCLANILLDGARFAGDDTLGGYNGILKDFLINLQLFLRTTIATEDAFPKSTEFERIVRALFEEKAQEALENKSKKCVSRREIPSLLMSSSPQ